ncbi:MAG: beta-ketoacyl-[acyl-carrier-protein] synthase family protein [Acidobacteriota bacterium]
MKPVAVTGVGAVSGFGLGVQALRDGLWGARTCIGPLDRFDASRHRTRIAAQVHEAVPRDLLGPRPGRVTLADRFALAASLEALLAARIDPRRLDAQTGVFFGSSTGGFWESELYFARLIGAVPGRPCPSLLAAQQHDGPGDAVARAFGASGPVVTLSSACTSGALAIAAAAQAIDAGEVDVAIAGGADSLCQLTYAGFNALRAVDPRSCRPFRADRAGLSLGEGAGALVLESAEHVRARGKVPLAWVAGTGSTCDAHHMTAPAPDGAGAARAIREALAAAGLPPAAIAFVNLHGTGTPHNDAAEWRALAAVFGDRASTIPATATKGAVGHLLGSAGAIEAVVTVLCLVAREVHPTPGPDAVDPATPLRLVTGRPLAVPGCRSALSTNLAFGGSNAAIVFSIGDDERA